MTNAAVLFRRPTLALIAGLSLAAVAAAADVSLVRVFPGWRDAESFKRISEYFSGHENTGGALILRTHPEERGGYYFLTRVANAGGPCAVRFELQVVLPDAATPRTFRFAAELPAGEQVVQLGLTGADWPGAKVNAVAWRLDVLDAAGRPLDHRTSYLWEKPAGE